MECHLCLLAQTFPANFQAVQQRKKIQNINMQNQGGRLASDESIA
jgi:hypothetical protein